ncbi:MAG: hypothetical protein WAN59_02405 [Candidatus Baltobacteraceae bacterium]
MTAQLAVEVVLTIPDNEAETALATLARLGVPLGGLERADLYRFEIELVEIEPVEREALLAALRSLETIYNPNKHALRVRAEPAPQPGELWVDEIHPAAAAARGPVRIAGRTLGGVRAVERFTAWRVVDAEGRPAAAEVVALAAETLLCNPAFQRSQRV